MKTNWLSISDYAARFGKRNTPALRSTLSRYCRQGRFDSDVRIGASRHYEIRSTAKLPSPLRRGRKVGKKQPIDSRGALLADAAKKG